MDSVQDTYLKVGGFPHSDIPGSMLVCQLPEAFRRLPRPSSPPTAKASTVCASSLDHITPSTLGLYALTSLTHPARLSRLAGAFRDLTVLLRNCCPPEAKRSRLRTALSAWLCLPGSPNGGAREARTPDLLRAKQALSQLSYGPSRWWVWLELNQRPHPYQGCALTD